MGATADYLRVESKKSIPGVYRNMADHCKAYEGLELFISTFQDSNYIARSIVNEQSPVDSSSQRSDGNYAMGPDDCKIIVEGYITRLA